MEFSNSLDQHYQAEFDVVISQNSMEHFGNPEDIIEKMFSLTRPNGRTLITFGPPWFAPYGSHMHFFLPSTLDKSIIFRKDSDDGSITISRRRRPAI